MNKKSPKTWKFPVYLIILALIFSIGLTFASVELPRLLHNALLKVTPSLEGDSHGSESTEFRTEIFLEHTHFRLIGYICFILILLLIVAGFATGRSGLSTLGAGALFLPVFAQFASVMFFLAGLGLFNLPWLPALDISFDIGHLGDIVYLPYNLLHSLFGWWQIDIHPILVNLLLASGLTLFLLGSLSWFIAKHRGSRMADFWVYRISRHPQYLGWMLWSYGMLLALKRIHYPRRSWGIPASLPWLLSMMVLVGVALLEERKMIRSEGAAYDVYRKQTSFLFPLPRFIRTLLAVPARLILGNSFPEKKRQIAIVLLLSTTLLMLSSHLAFLHSRSVSLDLNLGLFDSRKTRIEALVRSIKTSSNWRIKNRAADELAAMGRESIPSLVGLLNNPDPLNRIEAARALGLIGDRKAESLLLEKLSDPEIDVRYKVIEALGRLKCEKAVLPLISILLERSKDLSRLAAQALGRIGSSSATAALESTLDFPNWWDRAAVVDALGQIGSELPLQKLMNMYPREEVHVRRAIVVALLRIASPRCEATLREALSDEDPEVRLFADTALKRMRSAKSN